MYQILTKFLHFWAWKIQKWQKFSIFSECSIWLGNDPWAVLKCSVDSKDFISTPKHPNKYSEKTFQNRFWPLEKLFLLIGAWGSLKKSHFRGLYSELFRPNGGVPDCFLAARNSLRVYLKLVRATFSIYFVILEKKVFKNFLSQNVPNPYQIASLLSLKNWKMTKIFDFLKMLHMVRKWPLSGPEVFCGLERLYFHSQTPQQIFRKIFFKIDFGHLRSCFCL